MPDMDDFHAFNSTSGGSGGGGGLSCGGSMFTWMLVVIGIRWLIGKIAG